MVEVVGWTRGSRGGGGELGLEGNPSSATARQKDTQSGSVLKPIKILINALSSSHRLLCFKAFLYEGGVPKRQLVWGFLKRLFFSSFLMLN